MRGAFGPRLQFDGNVQQWNSPFSIEFNGPVNVRNAFTWTASVSVIQPITSLLAIAQQYKIQDIGVDVAAIRREATRREVAFHTIESYYRLLEAERLAEVADASVTQLEAQRKQAQSQFDNGVIGKNDLLRATLALASARQRLIQTGGQVILARGQLATAMGRSPDQAVEPSAFSGDPPPLAETGVEVAEGRAATDRLELRDLSSQIDQAQVGIRFAKAKLGAGRQRRRQLHEHGGVALPADRTRRTSASRRRGTSGTGGRRSAAFTTPTRSSTRRCSPRRSSKTRSASRRGRPS